jgi:transposase
MSLRPQPPAPVPAETTRVARAAFPRGNRYMHMRDALGTIYEDADFAALFPSRGQPAEPPWRLALVTVMQFAEGLSDRQAADAVRGRIDWKYALSLELTDAGFDASVLCEFRARLVAGGAEQQLLDRLLERFRAAGLLKARGRQRTDATHVLAAIRVLHRIANIAETLRAALNVLAVTAPVWLQEHAPAEWGERYSRRLDDDVVPDGQAARHSYAETIGRDGMRLLEAIYAPDAPPTLRQFPALEILRRMWVHQFVVIDGVVRLREADNLPPASLRMDSPYDPDARHGSKPGTNWSGYKVHLTETCDVDGPHLITNVETTRAMVADVSVTGPIHTALATKDLLPSRHFVDAGYISARDLVSSRDAHGIELMAPMRVDGKWQARAGTGYDITHFAIDWDAKRVCCPQGQQSVVWRPLKDQHGKPTIHIEFAKDICAVCEVRRLCTRAKHSGRQLTMRPQAEHLALQAARVRQATAEFQNDYAIREGIEGTISQGVRAFGLRAARYRGQEKVHLQHIGTAAAINLVRAVAWLDGVPRAQTRTSRFAALVAT